MDYRFEVVSGVWASEHPGGLAILNSNTGQIFVCNGAGAKIWLGLLEGEHLESIADRIAGDSGAEADKARQDASDFVAELQSLGLLAGRVS